MAEKKSNKKRKLHLHPESNGTSNSNGNDNDIDTAKPSAIFEPTGARSHTLSIALPGSIIANAKSHDQKTFLAGTIARALAVFCVDEVVILDDEPVHANGTSNGHHTDDDGLYTAQTDPSHFMAHLLSYLETPPQFRKTLFPMHPNLRTAGTLPSLDMPHHLRANEWCHYREGITVEDGPSGDGTYVDTGLPQKHFLRNIEIPPKTRVTLKLDQDSEEAEAVAPTTPREEAGYYWGYSVRRCASLSAVFTECPFDGGYGLSFGMSERGRPLSSVSTANVGPYAHMLVVFGGVAGLEAAAKADDVLRSKGIDAGNVSELFDHWVNVLPGQGSRTIRTEEAVWVGLMGLRSIVETQGT